MSSYEPHGALVAESARGVGGFSDLDVVIGESVDWLAAGGALVCEHGDTHRDAVLARAREAGYREWVDLDDLSGRARILVARR